MTNDAGARVGASRPSRATEAEQVEGDAVPGGPDSRWRPFERVCTAADVPAEPVRWLWQDDFALGKMHAAATGTRGLVDTIHGSSKVRKVRNLVPDSVVKSWRTIEECEESGEFSGEIELPTIRPGETEVRKFDGPSQSGSDGADDLGATKRGNDGDGRESHISQTACRDGSEQLSQRSGRTVTDSG